MRSAPDSAAGLAVNEPPLIAGCGEKPSTGGAHPHPPSAPPAHTPPASRAQHPLVRPALRAHASSSARLRATAHTACEASHAFGALARMPSPLSRLDRVAPLDRVAGTFAGRFIRVALARLMSTILRVVVFALGLAGPYDIWLERRDEGDLSGGSPESRPQPGSLWLQLGKCANFAN